MLKYYTEVAKTMSVYELNYALKDIHASWAANDQFNDPQHPYGAKLWAQFDAFVCQLQNLKGE